MIIRATTKLYNIARIRAEKNISALSESLPGEWYANLISTGRAGELGILFFHIPTMITVVILGKSIRKAVKELPQRTESLLIRNGFKDLVPGFQLDTAPEFYSTNSRNILANMNQLKFGIEWSLALSEELEERDISRIEDNYLRHLVGGKVANEKGGKRDYIKAKTILKELLEKKAVANTH